MNYATLEPHPNCVVGGFRQGTAQIERDAIFALLGPPTYDWREHDHTDGKVTLVWEFNTPKGYAELRDYWWNAKNEWSIAASNRKAALYLAKHLRTLGVPASTRFQYGKDCHLFRGQHAYQDQPPACAGSV